MIPKKFNVLGHEFKIKDLDYIPGRLGQCSKDLCLIELAINNGGELVPLSVKEHTYFHEITHVILDLMGEEKLSGNEKFVDTFAGLLHQILKTSK